MFSVEEGFQHWRKREEEMTTAAPVGIEENGTVLPNSPPDSPPLDSDQESWVSLEIMDLDSDSEESSSEQDEDEDAHATTRDSSSEERASLGSLGKWTWNINSIILDLSTANFTDTVAIKLMRNVSLEWESNGLQNIGRVHNT